MSTLLAVTVGGSCAPIITAIREYKPDFVCFIVSTGPRGSKAAVDGEGDPCGDSRKATCPECGARYPLGNPKGANIVTQTQLDEEHYTFVELDEPDAFGTCYVQIGEALANLQTERESWLFIADYTGGTKTMTAALAAVALELDWQLSLVKGARMDLLKVRNGTEVVALVNAAEVRARRAMDEAKRLFNAYAYASAAEILQGILRAAPLSTSLQHEIQAWITLCRAFDAWDRFDHDHARLLLEPYRKRFIPQWIFLTQFSKEKLSYVLVLDLIRNAERRAARGRYDDAVARLYRALELLAQVRMLSRDPVLISGDLDTEVLPEHLRDTYEALRGNDDKVKLGLRQDYELLQVLEDPLGKVYAEHCNHLLNALHFRNDSIFAHGLTPIDGSKWDEMAKIVLDFMNEAFQVLKVRSDVPQFPQWEG